MKELLRKIHAAAARSDRFTFDLRGQCRVLSGIVAAYTALGDGPRTDVHQAIAQALAQDGILGGRRDPASGTLVYESCRLFTDHDRALRFAREQGQRSITNLNRCTEIPVGLTVRYDQEQYANALHADANQVG